MQKNNATLLTPLLV